MSDTLVTVDAHRLADGFATTAMLMCYDACKLDGQALGWMPKLAYDQARDRGHLITCWRNDDLVGFLMWGIARRQAKIYQTWVRRDARMIEHGRALVAHVEKKAVAAQATDIRCWCAEDLAANSFWRAIGFRSTSWRWSPHRVRRRHLLWIRPIELTIGPHRPPARAHDPPPPWLVFPTPQSTRLA